MKQDRLWLVLVLALFCLPLFVGLDRADIDNDEAIYSFAVDRMVETGDWLEPKTIPNEDWAFLEKPPLKFWIVAAPIRLGLMPLNEFGIRFWDAAFGGLAFVYVFLIGRRLAGPVCGFVAALVLVAHRPLLFEHGLRSNNMEASLVLAYCGGIFHFLGWFHSEAWRARAGHIAAICLYFFLGFMTKFVAVAFLPMVMGVVVVCSPRGRHQLVRDWRVWSVAALLTALVIAPWFIWASLRYGWFFWQTIFTAHVYTRFTSFLDPSHLQPWHYYFTTMYARFAESGQHWMVIIGFVTLLVLSVMRRSVDGITVVLWAALPVIGISLGTSKIYHYVYPFLPPLALGIGYLIALLIMLGASPFRRALLGIEARIARAPKVARVLEWSPVRLVLVSISALALLVAAVTLVLGPINLAPGGDTVFKSSGLFRPILVSILFGLLGGAVNSGSQATAVVLVSSLLPLPGYRDSWSRIALEQHPIRQSRDCILDVERRVGEPGLYVDVPPEDMTHGVYYHFRRVRPWLRTSEPAPAALQTYLEDTAQQRPILVVDRIYQAFMHGSANASGVRERTASPPMLNFPPAVVLLLPGPYAVCAVAPRYELGIR